MKYLIDSFSFTLPLTFHGVAGPDGFVSSMSIDRAAIEQIRREMSDGSRASYDPSTVKLIEIRITEAE